MRSWSSRSLWFCVLAALACPLLAAGEAFRVGAELQVNVTTANLQGRPSAAMEADGDFVVAWHDSAQDGSSYGIFARRFSSAGSPLADEFQVNAHISNEQRSPSVALDADGDFVVAWTSYDQDGAGSGVFARRFSSLGSPVAAELQVNAYTTNNQKFPSVAADTDGDFVIAWESTEQDGSGTGLFARRFSSAGSPIAAEFQVNTFTLSIQRYPSVAVEADGDFVIAWLSSNQDVSTGAFAQRFSSAGSPLATELQVNTYTTGTQANPAIAVDADGDFVVAWESSGQDGSSYGIFAQRFSSLGMQLATELQVNTYTAGSQRNPKVASDVDGDFVVGWHSDLQDGSSFGVFARRFSSLGAPLASELQVNTYTSNRQFLASLGASADGDFVVAWQSRLPRRRSRHRSHRGRRLHAVRRAIDRGVSGGTGVTTGATMRARPPRITCSMLSEPVHD